MGLKQHPQQISVELFSNWPSCGLLNRMEVVIQKYCHTTPGYGPYQIYWQIAPTLEAYK